MPEPFEGEVQTALDWLASKSTKRDRENLARFAITAEQALGVSMANMKVLAKRPGRNHDLAAALWDTGCYEARMVAAMVDESERVTASQMERWCKDFDNWGICDTVCFVLFDRTAHAWSKALKWCGQREEFVKRAGFALLWALALHDKAAADDAFLACLPHCERGASDDRNFVKKAVNMALRAIGVRNAVLYGAVMDVAVRLAESSDAAAQWVGKTTLRELKSPASTRRLVKKPSDK